MATGSMFPYIPNTPEECQTMLQAIGISAIEDLFGDIPIDFRNPALNLPSPVSEMELRREMAVLARKNIEVTSMPCFLGGGAYQHYIPSIIPRLISRGEFLTSYTPYQAEASQGTLQSTYEFQTLIAQLLNMDVANAGMYDGATSVAEAALMACRITGRNRVVVLDSVNPIYREVLVAYTKPQGIQIHIASQDNLLIPNECAGLIVQHPNYFGYMENLTECARLIHNQNGLLITSVDPIAMGMFRPPGDYDTDIAVGEGQSIGIPLAFGGPYLGLFTCKEDFVRQMPGRIVGRTVDNGGQEGYVLTLQTREQHIRRERATSNVCTSESLLAIAAAIYLAALGRRGLEKVAQLCYHKAHYAASLISELPGYTMPITGTFFKEFVIKCPIAPADINGYLLNVGILGGLDISHLMPNCMLLCVTEMNTRKEIDKLITALSEVQ